MGQEMLWIYYALLLLYCWVCRCTLLACLAFRMCRCVRAVQWQPGYSSYLVRRVLSCASLRSLPCSCHHAYASVLLLLFCCMCGCKAVRSCDHGACARMQELFAPTRTREVPSCKSGFKRCCKKLARQMPAGMVPTWHRLYVKLS